VSAGFRSGSDPRPDDLGPEGAGVVWTSNSSWGGAYAASSDCLRRWTRNGQCFYADMSHVEVCTAETRDPRVYAAQCLAALRVAEAARRSAQDEAPDGTHYSLSTSNVDALDPGTSWGTHVNVALETELWEDLFLAQDHPARLGFVASAMSAAISFFGAGYVLPFDDGTTTFSLSARAHHLSRVHTYPTTQAFERGLLNSRREPHGTGQDRLHLIGFDFVLVSATLKASFLQCLLAAAEEGFSGLNLYAPVRALRKWSYGLDLTTGMQPAVAQLVDGRTLTLPQYVLELTQVLQRMVESGLIPDDVAPGAREHLALIAELARYAAEGSIARCAPHLDWAAKLLYLLDLCERDSVELGHPAVRLADHDFGNTNPLRGPFWALWREGHVDPLVRPEDVEAALVDGPVDGRGWVRGRLIQAFHQSITRVDWSLMELKRQVDPWARRLTVEMSAPDSPDRAQFARFLERARSVDELARLLDQGDAPWGATTDPIDDVLTRIADSNN